MRILIKNLSYVYYLSLVLASKECLLILLIYICCQKVEEEVDDCYATQVYPPRSLYLQRIMKAIFF